VRGRVRGHAPAGRGAAAPPPPRRAIGALGSARGACSRRGAGRGARVRHRDGLVVVAGLGARQRDNPQRVRHERRRAARRAPLDGRDARVEQRGGRRVRRARLDRGRALGRRAGAQKREPRNARAAQEQAHLRHPRARRVSAARRGGAGQGECGPPTESGGGARLSAASPAASAPAGGRRSASSARASRHTLSCAAAVDVFAIAPAGAMGSYTRPGSLKKPRWERPSRAQALFSRTPGCRQAWPAIPHAGRGAQRGSAQRCPRFAVAPTRGYRLAAPQDFSAGEKQRFLGEQVLRM